MAYTPAPENQTYSPHKIPACYGIDLRQDSNFTSLISGSISQDAGMINLMPYKYTDKASGVERVDAVTRNILSGKTVYSGASDEVCRGFHVWEKSPGTFYFYLVAGTKVYTATSLTGTWTNVDTLLNLSTNPVRFVEYIDDTNTKKLIMVDGIEGYIYTTNAAGTKITDADFPTPHVPFPIFMDGYIFLADAATGDIYNSDLNDPSAWTAGNFISSELYPDDIRALVKIDNYILAIGATGCEYFYDAGNASGSPLARQEGASLPFGCQIPNSIAVNKNTVMMIANSNDGQSVFKLIEGQKHSTIDGGWIISYMNANLSVTFGYQNPRGMFLRQSGELFYVLCLDGTTGTSSRSFPTLAYSFTTNTWTELTLGSSNSFRLPIWFAFGATTGNTTNYVAGSHFVSSNQQSFVAVYKEGTSGVATDSVTGNAAISSNVYQEIRTPNLDFDTLNVKMMHRFGVYATQNLSSASTVTLSVSYSDDDYATYSTVRTLNLSATTNFPFLTQLGMFRQRSMKVTCSDGSFLRFKGFEFDINKGQQ